MKKIGTQKLGWTLSPRMSPKGEAGPMTGLGTEPWLKLGGMWVPLDTNPRALPEGPLRMEGGTEGEGAKLDASLRASGELRTEFILGLSEEVAAVRKDVLLVFMPVLAT